MAQTVLIGVVAGVLAGMLGIGGGALFVPALVAIVGLTQVDAEATSLLAIVPVAAVGSWRSRAPSAAWRSSTRCPNAPSRWRSRACRWSWPCSSSAG
jgi:uncharacterized membrane protein YfcA